MERIIILHIYSPALNFSHKQALKYNQRLSLGQSNDCDVHIRDQNVADRQLDLKLTPSGFLVSNLSSDTEVFLNQSKVSQSCFFVPGDLLEFSSTSIQFEYQNKEVVQSTFHTPSANVASSELSFEYYVNNNLAKVFPPALAHDQYMTNDVYMKLLSFPFLLLFSLFLIFPSLSSCAITLAYLAIAHTLVIKFTKSQIPMSNFRLPISQKIYDQEKVVQKKIRALPEFDQDLLKNIKAEIKNFVKVKLPKVEKDIFSLNTSLKPEIQKKLQQREHSLKKQLNNVQDERLSKQLQKSLSLVEKQDKMHQNTKNLLMGLVLKLQDFQIQLDLLEGTLITHTFKDISTDFSERFHELQAEIDEYYNEFQQLNDVDEKKLLEDQHQQ
ncbi:MAG: FHA domain-containing protein [Candidatus Cloacimonetes bacterium]|nr:FHA domain-containing protein [Candidatus Cloacimonadota bacterium]